MECYVQDGYWEAGYTVADVCVVAPIRLRGDDAFRSSGARERFWRQKAEDELEAALDRVAKVVRKPIAKRKAVAEAFELIEWEALPPMPNARAMIAAIVQPVPDYTRIAALISAQRQEIEAARRIRKRKRDMEAMLLLI